MNVVKLNGIKVYNLTANRSLPEWASKAEKRRLKTSGVSSRRIELIQDLEMPDSATYITTTPDNHFLFVLGRYKPRVRCYDLSNLSMKFDRCVDYLPYKLVTLSEDYSKFALLQDERLVDVHAAGGHYFKFRVPRQGIDIAYSSFTCDLFIVSSRNEIYRMNLSEGRFRTPIISTRLENTTHGFTCCDFRKDFGLLLGASTVGCVDGWDTRTSEHVFGLNIRTSAPAPSDSQKTWRSDSVTCITFKDSLNVAVGTNEGMVHIYDLRQNRKPWHTRDSEFRDPIKTIAFHDEKVIASLPYCTKVWYLDSGKIFVGFNTGPAECNWMHHFPNSGLIMLALESPRVSTFFVPLLGEAPFWCSHLDHLVVECEPDVTTMYDGYKFITRRELADLGMLDLVGTQFLRAYMHGYFISVRLYNKIKDRLGIADEVRNTDTKPNLSYTISKASLRAQAVVEEFKEASTDLRFVKLIGSEKLLIRAGGEESDLLRIHEARLEKKRRRKEQRRSRASRAQSLVDTVDGD